MNDPTKVINVNLSSLLSLKAELLRKQTEVSRVKATRPSADEYSASRNSGNASSDSGPTSTSKKEKKLQSKEAKEDDNNQPIFYEAEDSMLLEKSHRVLEAKSKFYDRMTRSGGKLNSDDNCLVLFNRKRQDDSNPNEWGRTNISESYSSSSDESGDCDAVDPEDDWVEYTDCLGRTRKCLRKDLDDVKKRDTELAASMPERLDQSKPNWMLDTKGSTEIDATDEDDLLIGPLPPESVYSDGMSMVSKLEEQRVGWERKEKENLEKSDVHYQDVFFDEARQHGVGYYAFSTDEEERKRQQHELDTARQQTISEQEHRDALRAQREKIIAERVRAAKNRQRARLGLPPLEESDEKSANTEDDVAETKEERKERKRAEKLKRVAEAAEEERERERQYHIRPWDKEKVGVPSAGSDNERDLMGESGEWAYKPDREPMSQEQWNERQRTERNPEFAPVPETIQQPEIKLKRTNFFSMPPPSMYDAEQPMFYINNMPPPMPPPPAPNFVTHQSSKREKQFQRRSYAHESNTTATSDYDDASSRRGAAIAPPADLDAAFTLPPRAKKSKSEAELERSIEAGLRFLRNNSDKGTMSTKSSWTAKADY